MTTGRQAILDAFDQLFDAAAGRLNLSCTPEERAEARAQQSIERLAPADIAGLLASIPLAQRTHELLRAVAYERARQQLLQQLTAQAEPSPYGGH